MSIQGIEFNVKFEPPVPFTDEWIDAIYSSLEKNMAIVSADMFIEEDKGEIRFLLGVNNFIDSATLTEEVARDAIDTAFRDAAGPNEQTRQSAVSSTRVEVFA